MDTFAEFLAKIDNQQNREKLEKVLDWVIEKFPELEARIAWNQPMFTDHGTFIIAFSVSKKHLAVSPEKSVIERFAPDIVKSGYDYTKMLIRIPWEMEVDYSLLEKLIEFNIIDKADSTTFWRKY